MRHSPSPNLVGWITKTNGFGVTACACGVQEHQAAVQQLDLRLAAAVEDFVQAETRAEAAAGAVQKLAEREAEIAEKLKLNGQLGAEVSQLQEKVAAAAAATSAAQSEAAKAEGEAAAARAAKDAAAMEAEALRGQLTEALAGRQDIQNKVRTNLR